MTKRYKPDSLIFFAGVDWWSHNPGSDLQLSKVFSKKQRTLFVNSIGMGMPQLKSPDFSSRILRKIKSYFKYLKKINDNLYVFSPITLPTNRSPLFVKFNYLLLLIQFTFITKVLNLTNPKVFVDNPLFYFIAAHLRKSALVFFVADKYTADKSKDITQVSECEAKLISSADVVHCVSKKNAELIKIQRDNVFYTPHGVDVEHFSKALSDIDVALEIRDLKPPIVGYMGNIDKKILDIDLLHYIIKCNPNISYVFLGVLSEEMKALAVYQNSHFLGRISYSRLPEFLKGFDVCILPFNNSDWIKHCNPVKMKEYLAAGKPVVSTYFPEIEAFKDVIYCAETYEEFSQLLNRAIKENSDSLMRQRLEKVKNDTWDAMAERILQSTL